MLQITVIEATKNNKLYSLLVDLTNHKKYTIFFSSLIYSLIDHKKKRYFIFESEQIVKKKVPTATESKIKKK